VLSRPVSRQDWAAGLVATAVAVAAILVASRPDRLSLTGALCAAAAMVVAILPTAIWLWDRRSGPLPLLPMAGLFYIPFFALPPFLLDVVWPHGRAIQIYGEAPIIAGIDAASTGAALLGVAALVAGMAAARALPRIPAVTFARPGPAALAWVTRAALLAHALFWLVPALRQVPSLGQLFGPSGLLAAGLAVTAALTGALGRVELAVIFAGLLPLRLAGGLATGSLNNSLIFLLCMATVWVGLRPRAVIGMAVMLALGVLFYTPVQMFRTASWVPGQESLSLTGKIATAWNSIPVLLDPSQPLYHPYANTVGLLAWPLIKRVDQATVLQIVVNATPGEIPPWRGHSLINLLTGSIPRAVWHDKPEERFGNEFGRRYHLLTPDEHAMSANLPWLTELYANYLYPGVGVGMALIGLILGALDRALNRKDVGPVGMAFAGALVVPLLLPESNLSLMAGNLPVIAFSLWLALRLALGREAKAAANP